LIVVGIPLVLVLVYRAALWYVGELPNQTDPFEIYSVMNMTLFMQFMLPLLALIKGLSIFSDEVEEGTVMFLFLRPVPRTVLVAGKFLAYWITIGVLLTCSVILTFLILYTSPNSNLLFEDVQILIKDLWVLCLGVGAYGSILMLFGVFFKHSLQVSVLFFIWDAVAAYIPGSAYHFTIKHYLQSITPHHPTEQNLSDLLSDHPPTSLGASVLTLLLFIAACIVLTTLVIKHKQVDMSKN
jgi:ABC-2 type transport system permease protein